MTYSPALTMQMVLTEQRHVQKNAERRTSQLQAVRRRRRRAQPSG